MSAVGFIVVNKPAGITSRTAVNRIQRTLPRGTRIGHAGTLDPFATGALVVGIGRATRLIEYVQEMSKVYEAEFLLGSTSDTDDIDGDISPTLEPRQPTFPEIREFLDSQIGLVPQKPPSFSATKVDGRRAYALARRGHDFDLTERMVRIDRIDIHEYEFPQLEVEIECGKGTYIRSIARDLGSALGCGGLVCKLHRRRIGCFESPAEFQTEPVDFESVQKQLLPLEMALVELPELIVDAEQLRRFCNGLAIEGQSREGNEREIVVRAEGTAKFGIGEPDGNLIRPTKIFFEVNDE